MTEEQQIKEMAREICGNHYKGDCVGGECVCDCQCVHATLANRFYKAGYRKQTEGEWVKERNHRECSKCRCNAPFRKIKAGYHLQYLSKYCPNCGAKMKVGAE